jgi:hypothetical protein
MSYPIIALGAPNSGENGVDSGEVCFYEYDEVKEQVTKLTCLQGSNPYDNFGQSVSISHNNNPKRVVIGAPGVGTLGAANIYEYNPSFSEWELMEQINGIDKDEKFGSLVSISDDGTFIAIGNCPPNIRNARGSANLNRVRLYLYHDNSRRWNKMGDHSPSYIAFNNGMQNSESNINTLSDISVLTLDDVDRLHSRRQYYVAFTSAKYYTDKYLSLARIYKYNNTMDEWDQTSLDTDWFCYKSTDGSSSSRSFYNVGRNALKLYSFGNTINFVRGCGGTNNGGKPYITMGIYNTTYDNKIDLPIITSPCPAENYINLFLSEDARVLSVYLNCAVYIYEIDESMNKWVLSETITMSSNVMALSEGILVTGDGITYTIYQNVKHQQHHKKQQQHGSSSSSTSSHSGSTRSPSSAKLNKRAMFLISILFIVLSIVGFAVYQLMIKHHGIASCSFWNSNSTSDGIDQRIMVTNARPHRTNFNSAASRIPAYNEQEEGEEDQEGNSNNPDQAERMNLKQEPENTHRSIV